MAEDYEAYHVPQQSRREKLRVIAPHNNLNFSEPSGLLPLYDPGLLQVDFHKQEEGPNFMGFIGGMMNASTSHHPHQPYEIQPSVLMNPNPIHEINGNPFLYSTQNLRDFDFNGEAGTTMLSFKPQSLNMGHEVNATGQGLSLSLSTQQANLPQELNLHRYQSAMIGEHYTAPLGPFTGYASILGASRFLRPAQQLLEEFCDVGQNGVYAERINSDVRATDASLDAMNVSGIIEDSFSYGDTREQQKKSRLISMLEEVYRRYKQYYQQLQAVMASFESVAGLANAAPFAHLAVKGMSKNFRCLKNAIMDQLHLANRKTPGQGSQSKDDKGIYGVQRQVHSAGFLDQQPVWRPQRGLPERAVTVLRAWLFEHFLHPYPTDTDKLMLAKQTGLSRSQVSNWFINARVRLWKPMVEEIHMLETRQAQKAAQPREERTITGRPGEPAENASTSTHKLAHGKHCKHEMSDVAMAGEEGMHIYDDLSNPASIRAPVSLTLGLHQNNVVTLSDQFSLNDHGFGLENTREGYGGLGGFEGHGRHYGRDIMGGQLLHDFVG